ncbi:hypothetical protein M409DRAFT_67426 [Zasmidium cellare ATCC 36951]|uniref:DUF4291 domain-containing protein n=1 Tax=Zasmidium cellare ATCC 36951 TaxID=1080233 RepID=A0A6A6CD63_ZASCE|nr:uncharacterized protein M409DRAFT_67426 [Zasmidium cellare ATCC 36951]KAF2165147.1 hypothetical protein M409DRAFT_67426 [Zasmidium cellare ATCC 36951]
MAKPAFREIRASHDDECITVYQEYNASIAESAIESQKLSASPLYRPGRATWIKPSWCWMMYRSGYSLLKNACPAGAPHARGESVVVQWDPERGPRLERLEYRGIQIGIPGGVRDQWIEEWIEGIEDVTQMARDMKKKLDEDLTIGVEELVRLGLMPDERLYRVDDEVFDRLGMASQK